MNTGYRYDTSVLGVLHKNPLFKKKSPVLNHNTVTTIQISSPFLRNVPCTYMCRNDIQARTFSGKFYRYLIIFGCFFLLRWLGDYNIMMTTTSRLKSQSHTPVIHFLICFWKSQLERRVDNAVAYFQNVVLAACTR